MGRNLSIPAQDSKDNQLRTHILCLALRNFRLYRWWTGADYGGSPKLA